MPVDPADARHVARAHSPHVALTRGLAVLAAMLGVALLAAAVMAAVPRDPSSAGNGADLGPAVPSDPHAGLERLRSHHRAERTADDGAVAVLGGSAADAFEPLRFVSRGDGRIEPAPAWVDEHIVTEEVPLLEGSVRCHERLLPQLRGALGELEERDLGHLIDAEQYGGCWVPRHILRDADRALSLHAWGLAVDINVAQNPYGAEPRMDPRVVDAFERWGFTWGGRWRTPDGMHFELIELRDEPIEREVTNEPDGT